GCYRDPAEFIVVEALGDGAGLGVDDEPNRPQVVLHQPVGDAGAVHQVGGAAGARVGVDEVGEDAVSGELGGGAELILVEPGARELAADALGDAAAEAVDHVVDGGGVGAVGAVGDEGAEEVAELVVRELQRAHAVGAAKEVAVGGGGVFLGAVAQDAILGVVAGGDGLDAVDKDRGAVAVGVVAVFGDEAVALGFDQAAGGVVGVEELVRGAVDGL